jgi:hypothetical protein
MAEETVTTTPKVQWKWVIVGVVIGLLIMILSYTMVAPTFHSVAIQSLVMLAGFLLTGIVVGYFSPGVTIREALYSGVICMAVMGALIASFDWEVGQHSSTVYLMLFLGGMLAQVGGWIGEKLQGTLSDEEGKAPAVFHSKWVLVGTGLGVVLNILFVFIPAKIVNLNLMMMFITFSVSFVITGFIVGYKSPGVTLWEPAVAGLAAVVIDWLFIQFGLGLGVQWDKIAFGMIEGLLLALFGAWIGERIQAASKPKTESTPSV